MGSVLSDKNEFSNRGLQHECGHAAGARPRRRHDLREEAQAVPARLLRLPCLCRLVCPSINLSARPSIRLSVDLSIHLSTYVLYYIYANLCQCNHASICANSSVPTLGDKRMVSGAHRLEDEMAKQECRLCHLSAASFCHGKARDRFLLFYTFPYVQTRATDQLCFAQHAFVQSAYCTKNLYCRRSSSGKFLSLCGGLAPGRREPPESSDLGRLGRADSQHADWSRVASVTRLLYYTILYYTILYYTILY